MKNLPAIISIATVAVLLLLAVAASVIDSLPFALIASYVVGFACSLSLLALFVADYAPRSPRLIALVSSEAEEKRAHGAAARAAATEHLLDHQADAPYSDPITVNFMATMGLRNDPATVSLV
jgi:hypothetical protein